MIIHRLRYSGTTTEEKIVTSDGSEVITYISPLETNKLKLIMGI